MGLGVPSLLAVVARRRRFPIRFRRRSRTVRALPQKGGWSCSRSRATAARSGPRTGATAYKVYAGSGLAFNNNLAGLALGRDGTAYLGGIGGIVALREP